MEWVVKSLVKKPVPLKKLDKLSAFKRMVCEELDKISDKDKGELAFEIVCFVCSLAELYWMGRHKGEVKKEAVLDCLLEASVESRATIDRMIELALKSGEVVKKTSSVKIARFFKKLLKGTMLV